MTAPISETSPSTRGRILAVLYLLVIVGGVLAQVFISDRLVVRTDAERTAANILANKSLYRLAFTIFMVEMAAQVATTALFYDLLKPVNRSVARVSAIMGLIAAGIKTHSRLFYYTPLILLSGAPYLSAMEPTQLAVLSLAFVRINNQGAAIALIFFGFETVLRGWLIAAGIKTHSRLFYYTPLILLSGAPYLSAMEPAQLAALSLAFVRINNQGAAIALIFFGFETVLRGWLIFRSGFLPRFLGVLSMVGGLGWLTYLWPPLGSQVFVGVALFAIVGVIATSGWLLIRGVDDARWRQRAALAATSIWR